jgi:hypothetical protein
MQSSLLTRLLTWEALPRVPVQQLLYYSGGLEAAAIARSTYVGSVPLTLVLLVQYHLL